MRKPDMQVSLSFPKRESEVKVLLQLSLFRGFLKGTWGIFTSCEWEWLQKRRRHLISVSLFIDSRNRLQDEMILLR